jgi:hypothetical protein
MAEPARNDSSDHTTEPTHIVVTIDPPDEATEASIPSQSSGDLEDPRTSSSTTVEDEKKDTTVDSTAECRICLMSDDVGQLIEPCHCTGSVKYVHLKCLKLWLHETADLTCEICKSTYNDALLPELEPDLLIGLEERNRRNNRRLRHQPSRDDNATDRIAAEQQRRVEEQRHSTRRFWMRALCFTVPLTILIVMLLFLGMNASDSAWASVLLRILAFALPAFIVLRIVFSCWDVARFGRGYAHDDAGVRRDAGV